MTIWAIAAIYVGVSIFVGLFVGTLLSHGKRRYAHARMTLSERRIEVPRGVTRLP